MLIEANLLDNGNNPWVKNSSTQSDLVLSPSGIFIRSPVQCYQL